MKVVLFWFFITGSVINIALGAPTGEEAENVDYRLNDDVKPTEYIIDLEPHFDNESGNEPFTFDGRVVIILQATKPNVKTITLHKEDLNITEHTLTKKSKYFPSYSWNFDRITINNYTHDERTQKYSLELNEPLAENQAYELTFVFKGKLRTDMKGFYRSSYKEGNEIKWLASTQMQPVHARKVFPCFDEPRFKAIFNIIINRPTHFAPSLSNTMLLSSYQWRSSIRETFEKTPKMSTYLVAFIVSEFQCRQNDKNTFGVCSRPNAFDQTEYSFDEGQKTLAKFDELFGYKYDTHISKMSMAAIPDFSAGAMENWGLLTYRETALLYTNMSTAMDQQRVATVIAHEQAHMWFGDLVTCDWWSNTWLNEGFARFFQYFGTALVETNWGLDQQFVVEQLQTVFGADSLEDSQALTHEVNTPDEIGNRFGSISYNKGASIIRMVEHTLGHDTFITALKNYLEENALSTSLPDKLYAAFQNHVQNGLNVTDFMSGWISQPGYPVLNVNVSPNRTTIVISQKKFLRNNADHEDNTLWNIPISYATDKQNTDFIKTNATVHLTHDSLELNMDPFEWIVFNVQQTGYYRVNYDDASWAAIGKILNDSPTSIHILNRAQIVDDALNLARAHQLNYSQALDTIHYLQNETDYVPWLSAFNNFDFILARFKNEDASIFKKFILDLLNHVYSHLGFYPKEVDSRLDIYNRNNVLKYACKLGHEKCITDARSEFDKLLQRNYKIPVDLVPVVYCSVISEGSDQEWNHLWEKFQSENVAAEQVTILNALGCTKQSNLITKYLDLILTDYIRLQDKHSAFVSTLKQQENTDLVLDFIITNHKKITNVFETENELPSILTQVVGRSTTNEQIEKVRNFVKENELKPNENLETALKNAEFNLKWAEKNVPIIRRYLGESIPDSAVTHTVSCITLMGLVFVSYFNY